MKGKGLEPLDDALADFFRVERERPDPGAPFRDAVFGALSSRLALPQGDTGPSEGGPSDAGQGPSGSADGGASHAVATVGAASPVLGALIKPVVVAAFAAGVGAGAGSYATLAPPQVHTVYVDRVVSVPVPATPVSKEEASGAASAEMAPETSTTSALVALKTKASADHRPERDIDLATERTLLDTARTALGRGDAVAALDALRRHQQQFPMSQLSDEREVTAIQALVAAGRTSEARVRAAEFLGRRPTSPLRAVLEKLLGELP